MNRIRLLMGVAVISAMAFPTAALPEGTVEVLHWWTSGGEAKAVGELKSSFEAQGGTWIDSPIAGGGGDAAMTALRARVVAGNPPTAVQFNAVADKLKEAGITPLAHGGQPWQDATVFEVVALGIGGADFYRKALVELDQAALTSDTMVKVFDQLRRLRGYVDEGFSGRDWNLATAMVMNGQAAFQIMGDWAKGEFLAAGKVPGKADDVAEVILFLASDRSRHISGTPIWIDGAQGLVI